MAKIRVGPKEDSTHHLHLKGLNSDRNEAELGLILCNPSGVPDKKAIKRRAYPRSAIKTYTGQQKYSDLEPPFEVIAMDDFSGGRGKEIFDDDQSRYYDGLRADTRKSGRVILGGQETYCDGDYRDLQQSMPGSVTWNDLTATGPDITTSFTATSSFTLSEIWILVRKVGEPSNNLKLTLLSDADVEITSKAVATNTVLTDLMSQWVKFDIADQSIVDTTTYKIKVENEDTNANSTNHVVVATDGTDLYYRLLDSNGGNSWFKYFTYNHGVYAVSFPYDGTASKLYLCGYTGACDSNTGNLDKLIDASRSGSGAVDTPFADDAIGGIAIITKGPGSNEIQPWREVTARDSGTQLDFDSEWEVEHTTASEYAIINTDTWYEMLTLDDYVTDFTVADKFVYFAFGEDTVIQRYREYNDGGTWTQQEASEDYYAKYIQAIRDPSAGTIIYGTRDNNDTHGTHVWRARVPLQWGNLYSLIGEVCPTDEPWDEQSIANCTQSVTGGIMKVAVTDAFTTGYICKNEVSSIDITQGDKFGFLCRVTGVGDDAGAGAMSAGDLQIGFSDQALMADPEVDNMPAFVDNEWTWVTVDITPLATGGDTDGDAVVSFGINVPSDLDLNFELEILGGIQLLRSNPYYTQLPQDALITGLQEYAGGQSSTYSNCWVFTENKVYEIQSDSGYTAVPLPIHEMESLRGFNTGKASTVNDVYLLFSLGFEKLERYYNYSLEDVGVDGDAGLPDNRRGLARDLASYPGGIIQVTDAGADGWSSINYRTGGWHELYRAPFAGVRIESVFIQAIPGSTYQRLWFSQYGDICWIPIALSPEETNDYRYTHELMVQSGKAFSSLQDVEKFFSSVKLITEDLSGTDQFIEIDYRTDNNASWITMEDFNTSPSQSLYLDEDNQDEYGIYIELRVRMYTQDNTVTPVLRSIIIESMTRVPVKFAYDLTFRLADEEILLGEGKGQDEQSGREKMDILDDWVSSPTPIKMYSQSEFEDNKWVFLEPAPVSIISRFEKKGKEVRVATMTLIEI